MSRGVLAIEASQRDIGVAVIGADGTVHTAEPRGDPRERDLLLPAIEALCLEAGLAPTDLRAIAVSTGPGGFTGLRVSIATAKGICEALGIPAIDVPSALVAAQGVVRSGALQADGLVVALAAKGEGCYATRVGRSGGGALVVEEERSVTAVEFAALSPRAVVADEHLPAPIREWCERTGVPIVAPRLDVRDCLALACERRARGEVMDPLHLVPRYPREPEAVTLWRQRHGQ